MFKISQNNFLRCLNVLKCLRVAYGDTGRFPATQVALHRLTIGHENSSVGAYFYTGPTPGTGVFVNVENGQAFIVLNSVHRTDVKTNMFSALFADHGDENSLNFVSKHPDS